MTEESVADAPVPEEITVRGLEARDLAVLARIIKANRQLVEGVLRRSQAAASGGELDEIGLMLDVGFALLEHAESDLWPWLASMAGVTPAQFDRLPAAAVFEMIQAIVTGEDWSIFLAGLSSMRSGRLKVST